MEGLPAKTIDRRFRGRRQQGGLGPETRPVNIVADQRVADRGQMDPDLVGAAGFQAAFHHAGDRVARWRRGIFPAPASG